MSKKDLQHLIEGGDVEGVKQFLEGNPDFNINGNLEYGWTALHVASEHDHHEIISVFLAHPDINVNVRNLYASTAFLIACANGKVEVVKLLLRDPRVDINLPDKDGCTPLWYASQNERTEVIKWVIASGREINPAMKVKWVGQGSSAIEIARARSKAEVVSLLERFTRSPALTRHEVRVELGLADKDAAELFAMTVFLCDDYLRIKEPNASDGAHLSGTARFFNTIKRLPMELQMVLCYRVYESAKQNIKSKDSEAAFKSLAGAHFFQE